MFPLSIPEHWEWDQLTCALEHAASWLAWTSTVPRPLVLLIRQRCLIFQEQLSFLHCGWSLILQFQVVGQVAALLSFSQHTLQGAECCKDLSSGLGKTPMKKMAYIHSQTWLLTDHQPSSSTPVQPWGGEHWHAISPHPRTQNISPQKKKGFFPPENNSFSASGWGANTFIFLRGNPMPVSTEWTLDAMA